MTSPVTVVFLVAPLLTVHLRSPKAPRKRSQHCWTLHAAYVCTTCCMLLRVVGSCYAKFETGQTFKPTAPNISFVPWSPKRSATMLDPFVQLFQHCWGQARSLPHDLLGDSNAITSRDRPTLLRIDASVCTPLPTRTQQLPTLLAQQQVQIGRDKVWEDANSYIF